MKTKLMLLLLTAVMCVCGTVFAADEEKPADEQKPDPNFYIFICFGQSNSEGYPGIVDEDKGPVSERFKMYAAVDMPKFEREKGNWYPATPPLCRSDSGICPADYFGRVMAENLPEDIKVGVLNVSVAGCKIELFMKDECEEYMKTAPGWMKGIINTYGGNPYDYFVAAAKDAQKYGVIKGMLLHQGESNSGQRDWPEKVKSIYESLLTDLNLKAEDVPLLAGECVNSDVGGACGGMNPIIQTIHDVIPTAYAISSSGCKCRQDHLHFSPEGYRELGKRYAEKMLSIMGYEIEKTEAAEN